jgi:hypothetical protein
MQGRLDGHGHTEGVREPRTKSEVSGREWTRRVKLGSATESEGANGAVPVARGTKGSQGVVEPPLLCLSLPLDFLGNLECSLALATDSFTLSTFSLTSLNLSSHLSRAV